MSTHGEEYAKEVEAAIQSDLQTKRELAQEDLLRRLSEAGDKEAAEARIKASMAGYVAQAEAGKRARVVPSSRSSMKGKHGKKGIRKHMTPIPEQAFQADPIRKRTPEERVNALTLKLVTSFKENPALVESILEDIRKEFWAAGHPIGLSDMRLIAASLLNQVHRRGQVDKARPQKKSQGDDLEELFAAEEREVIEASKNRTYHHDRHALRESPTVEGLVLPTEEGAG